MASIAFSNVEKYFDDQRVIRDFTLRIGDGEFVVLVGPSGCGKSTLLRMLAGLERITEGEIRIDDTVVNEQTPQERNVAMVFQNYALYPHMTVRQNLAFPLKMRKLDKSEIDRRIQDAADLLGLEPLLDRKPKQLSGGQRQRIAMGRSIVRDPSVFLMDEPLSNLDAKLRVQIRTEIAELQKRMQTTTVYVTHDQVEAMTLGQRVVVLKDGELQQVATPQALYDAPANVFVAGFIGSPAMNIVRSRLEKGEGGTFRVRMGGTSLPVSEERAAVFPGLEQKEGEPVLVGLRPESFFVAEEAASREAQIGVVVDTVEMLGHETIVYGRFAEEGEEEAQTVTARLGPNLRIDLDEEIRLGVDTEKIYLFDAEDETSLMDVQQVAEEIGARERNREETPAGE